MNLNLDVRIPELIQNCYDMEDQKYNTEQKTKLTWHACPLS